MKLPFKIILTLLTCALVPVFISGIYIFLFYYLNIGQGFGFYSVLTTSLVFVISVFGVVYFSFRFANNATTEVFNKFRLFVEAIASGDPTKHLEVKSLDGLGSFAETLNHMADRLTEIHVEMDKNVKEKTLELSGKVEEVNKSNRAVLNLLEDIDQEKARAEAMVVVRTRELSDERARLLASINSLSLGFIIADVNNKILLKNPAILKILEVEGDIKTLHDVSKYFENMNIVGSCAECVKTRLPVEVKNILYKKKYLKIFCAPVFDDTHVIGYVFLAEDITEAKVMERSREEFFAVASHELRTPLTAIRGNTEMILDLFGEKVTDPEMREMLQDIDASSIRLIGIVNDFLEVSRIEQGKLEIKKDSFVLQEVITKVVRDLQGVVAKKKVALKYTEPTSSLPSVFADKNRVEQILVNLIGNSLKFTKEGYISIELEKSGSFLKIIVSDSGIGISEQNQSRLFRKFQQAGEDMIARDVTQGTGLGLYISQLLISAMGGVIKLDKSELGKGSTFSFTVPIAP
jgi:signal transduction histidine kinase